MIAQEEIGVLLDQVQEATAQLDRFGKLVKLFAFYQFPSAAVALENARAVASNETTDELITFLTSNLKASKPSQKKSGKDGAKMRLGVADPKLASVILEKTQINCVSNDTIAEISRGLRMHFGKMVSEDIRSAVQSSIIGLGHNLSRDKIKFNANKSDNMIIQACAMIEFLDKDINTFSQRIREWYSYHFPELYPVVKDNILFAKTVLIVGNRNNLNSIHDVQTLIDNIQNEQENEENLQNEKSDFQNKIKAKKSKNIDEIINGGLQTTNRDIDEKYMNFNDDPSDIFKRLVQLLDEERATKIVELSHSSIGVDIIDIDLVNIRDFCRRIVELSDYRESLMQYMSGKMNLIAPNLSSVIGEMVGAKLISQAGSLVNLAKCPASTVQILGAEKSLFRALKTRGKTPKYGIIYHSSFIGRSPLKYKGRVSRFLAHKCSIASRIDSFSDNPNSIIGKKLHEHIEEKLQYYKNNEPEDEDLIPRSNAQVMQEALMEFKEYNLSQLKKDKKVKKVKKSKLHVVS